jgi:hypothetical protein
MLFEIHTELEKFPPGSEDEAVRVLEQCLTELKRIEK